jgi:serine/threonine protein kinase
MPDLSKPSSGPNQPPISFVPPSVEELTAQFPRYEILELIGHGGMGAVYKARQPKLDRAVAIKILPKTLGADHGFAERFEREAQAMAKLHHSRIVAVHDFGETPDGYLYIVMEFVRGTTLGDLIKNKALKSDQILAIVTQICDALKYAHEHGVIHRDIKPANIMLDVEGQVKVADFGLAKLADTHERDSLTQANVAMGTPNYVAPEALVLDTQVDQRADIFALGVLLYEMLTGNVPRGVFVAPSDKIKNLDPRLDDVVMRAMQSEPENRYQQVTQFWTDIDRIRTTPSPAKMAPTPARNPLPKNQPAAPPLSSPKKSRFPVGMVAAIVLLAGGLGLWALVANSASPLKKAPVTKTNDTKISAPDPIPNQTEEIPPTIEPATPIVAETDQSAQKKPPRPLNPEEIQREQMRERLEAVMKSRGPKGDRPDDRSKKRPDTAIAPGRRPTIAKLRERPRLTSGNVLVARLDGGSISPQGLADLPQDLDHVLDLQVNQLPSWNTEDKPFAVALTTEGTVLTWGASNNSQPSIPPDLTDVKKIAVGLGHVLGLRADGTVVAWGRDAAGQCDVPDDLTDVVDIAAGGQHSLALRSDGVVVTWGADSEDSYNHPPDTLAQGGFSAIHARGMHSIALRNDGSIIAWGDPDHGVTEIPAGLKNVTAITSTWNTAAALLNNGKVIVWGAENVKDPVPSEPVVEIDSTIDSLLMRTRSNRWLIRTEDAPVVTFPAPAFGRSPTRLIPAGKYLFAYYAPDSEVPVEEPANPLPASDAARQLAELIDKFKTGYEDTILKSHQEIVADLDQKYLAAIDREQSRASEAADLDAALAFRTESERVTQNNPLPPVDPVGLPERLLELRRTYREQLTLLTSELAERAATLTPPFDNALQGLETEFTRAEQLDDAIVIRDAREFLAAEGAAFILGASAPAIPTAPTVDKDDLFDSLEDSNLPQIR